VIPQRCEGNSSPHDFQQAMAHAVSACNSHMTKLMETGVHVPVCTSTRRMPANNKVVNPCTKDPHVCGQVLCQENVQTSWIQRRQLEAPGCSDVRINVQNREQNENAPNQDTVPCTVQNSL